MRRPMEIQDLLQKYQKSILFFCFFCLLCFFFEINRKYALTDETTNVSQNRVIGRLLLCVHVYFSLSFLFQLGYWPNTHELHINTHSLMWRQDNSHAATFLPVSLAYCHVTY